jgi:hypothetical protein
MFTIGQTIDTKAVRRLYVTTRSSQEVGMYRQGIFSPVYYLTINQDVIGIFTQQCEANEKLGEILEVADLSQECLLGCRVETPVSQNVLTTKVNGSANNC